MTYFLRNLIWKSLRMGSLMNLFFGSSSRAWFRKVVSSYHFFVIAKLDLSLFKRGFPVSIAFTRSLSAAAAAAAALSCFTRSSSARSAASSSLSESSLLLTSPSVVEEEVSSASSGCGLIVIIKKKKR